LIAMRLRFPVESCAQSGKGCLLPDPVLDAAQRGGGVGRGKRRALGQTQGLLAVRVPQGEIKEGLLALHVEVEGALGDACSPSDVGHLGAAKALGNEDLGGGGDQVLEAPLGNRARHGRQYT
jgi:hypothetical protein